MDNLETNIRSVVYRGRSAIQMENSDVRVTVLKEGGHVASFEDKHSGVDPLWKPPWRSIDPSTYRLDRHPEYGADSESKLLSGLMGHNLALDIFGPPSSEEAAAGLTVHGESSVVPYEFKFEGDTLLASAHLPLAQMHVERKMRLLGRGVIDFEESVTNLTAMDRPIAWTQHVTLGPPFIEGGSTRLHLSTENSAVYPYDLGYGSQYQPGQLFRWPHAPCIDGTAVDLSVYPASAPVTSVTAHLIPPTQERGFFLAWHPPTEMLFGYAWRRRDFPWISLWLENRARKDPPWNGNTTTWGIEFGASPYAEERVAMVNRNSLLGESTFCWLRSRSSVTVRYKAFLRSSADLPSELPSDLMPDI